MKTKKTIFIPVLLMAGLLLSSIEMLSQQSTDQLFEKALYLEEAKGELQDAIEIFHQIAENQDADQSLQAKAPFATMSRHT